MALPQPRLQAGLQWSRPGGPVFTDFKVHDICEPDDRGGGTSGTRIRLPWSSGVPGGKTEGFLTKRLWGGAGEMSLHFFHHGFSQPLRQSVLAHAGGGLLASRPRVFQEASEDEQETR